MKKPAGWYPDEADSTRVRYWNGKIWTDIFADSASGEVSENNLFDNLAENLSKAILGTGLTVQMVSLSLRGY